MALNSKILQRFFKGKYSRHDYLTIKGYLEEPEKEEEIKKLIQDQWFDLDDDSLDDDGIDHVLHKIHYLIRMEDKQARSNRFAIIVQRVAAIFIVSLLISSLTVMYLRSHDDLDILSAYAEIQCPPGARTQFALPDGTIGWLNSGSSLKYNTQFDKRVVDLKGEAYFEVTHMNSKIFEVHTNDLNVLVLGTKFNVSAYEEDIETNVVLNEGKVQITNDKGSISETIKPDEMFVLNKHKSNAAIAKVNASDYSSWKDGYLKFRGEPFCGVIKKMERWYNVDIEVKDELLNNFKYRGTFKNERLDEILRLIALTAPLKYSLVDRTTNEDGTYQKRKVIIERNNL